MIECSFMLFPLQDARNVTDNTDKWAYNHVRTFTFGQRMYQIQCRKDKMPFFQGLKAGEA
jgi:uncharacterized Zn finger protein (UPF0148 family)